MIRRWRLGEWVAGVDRALDLDALDDEVAVAVAWVGIFRVVIVVEKRHRDAVAALLERPADLDRCRGAPSMAVTSKFFSVLPSMFKAILPARARPAGRRLPR